MVLQQGEELEMLPTQTLLAEKVTHTKNEADKQDPIQSSMGAMGKWQVLICGVVFLLKFPVAWHQMSIIFLAPPVDFNCTSIVNNTEDTDQCVDRCEGYVYDRSVFHETIIMEWDLVCTKKLLADFSQTIVMLGILVGNMVFGAMSDKHGRRIPLVVAVIMQLICGVATAFVPWFWLFCVLRFLTAIATGGTMVTSFVLVMEIVGSKWRELINVLYQIPFNLGHLTLPVFAYFFRNWRTFQFALSIPSVLLISYYWLVPESPRWLFAVGRVDESVTLLEKAAKVNSRPTQDIRGSVEKYATLKATTSGPAHKGNILDLVRTPNMRIKTICICFNWFVCGLSFFGVAQYIGQTGGNIFVNVAISAGLTLPGTIACILALKYLGRKKTLIISNTTAGIAMLLIPFVDQQSWAVVALASAGILGMSISFPTVYLYAGELFPTVVRNIGVGTASMLARFGSMSAPFVAGMATEFYFLPPVIFGVVPLIGALLTLLLPETMGHPLPETIEDGENFGKKVKPLEQ